MKRKKVTNTKWPRFLGLMAALVLMAVLTVLSVSAEGAKNGVQYNEQDGNWYLYNNGQIAYGYNGTAWNNAGLWVIQDGRVNFGVNGVQYINVGGENGWWNVENGRVAYDKSVVSHNDAGWWYCPNGKVDFHYYGVAPNAAGWWRIEGGKVNFNFHGLAQNAAGWWKCTDGKVDFGFNGLFPNLKGWWFIENGRIKTELTGNYNVHGITYAFHNGCVIGAPGRRIIYLTFDDGPYMYTRSLLNTLAKYHVPATFFVTNAYPGYSNLIRQEKLNGHQVAVHTYTHSYGQVYSSTSAYWRDFDRTNNLICRQTGEYTTLFRFPGGSSNTVSRNYCSGVMSALSRQAGEKGYIYFDWNVSSGDAGQTSSPGGVYSNCVGGVSRVNPAVVLCHDVKPWTVGAMDSFISWALDHGYAFLPLTEFSPTAHQRIAN